MFLHQIDDEKLHDFLVFLFFHCTPKNDIGYIILEGTEYYLKALELQ